MTRRMVTRIAVAVTAGLLLSAPAGSQEKKARPDPETLRRARELQAEVSAHFRAKEYKQAAAGCNELIKLLPESPVPRYNLACAQARLGKKDEAFAALEQAIKVGYVDAEHMSKDEDLAGLRDDKRFAKLLTAARDNYKKQIAKLPYDKGEEIKGLRSIEANPEDGLRYRLRLSEKASAKKPHRLIIWLHPSGGSMNKAVETLAPEFAEQGFALLVLTQKQFAGWSNADAKRLLEATLPDVARNKEVDARRPILLGYSAGGQLALELWNAEPDRWGGVILDAAYPVQQKEGRFVPRPLPDTPAIKKTPFFVLVGERDGGAPLWQKLAPVWRKGGVPLTIRFIEGKGHAWLFDKERRQLLAAWLKEVAAGKLPKDPEKKRVVF